REAAAVPEPARAGERPAPARQAATAPAWRSGPTSLRPASDRRGTARLRGRVVAPAVLPPRTVDKIGDGKDGKNGEGAKSSLFDGPSVIVTGAGPTTTVRLSHEGTFVVQLPAGVYTVVVSLIEGLVGVARDVVIEPELDREIVIKLAPGAAIRGRV